ncbi:hypothetical protein [Catenuloplanes atrovinosus]|uniref:Uncharacterized protein n=1 Tax=Catenuloplanes atrovinosus TaxID=137266 RepID=A0AAE3YID4_9ACTN|nr:hypothetical protein [Catenuloplanes atrovinosus]MDR7273472.1 hypothetical protein [Catenuloplanes atrovinosus]
MAVLAPDLLAVRRGLPGAIPVAVICGAAGTALPVVVPRAAACWQPGGPPWPALARAAASRSGTDPRGSLLPVAGLGVAGACTWQLPPPAIPAFGCLLIAALAVERRPRL